MVSCAGEVLLLQLFIPFPFPSYCSAIHPSAIAVPGSAAFPTPNPSSSPALSREMGSAGWSWSWCAVLIRSVDGHLTGWAHILGLLLNHFDPGQVTELLPSASVASVVKWGRRLFLPHGTVRMRVMTNVTASEVCGT